MGPKINKLSTCFQKSSNCSSSLNSIFLYPNAKPEQVFKHIGFYNSLFVTRSSLPLFHDKENFNLKYTCLLAVQNFLWKNSSFIWIPTAGKKKKINPACLIPSKWLLKLVRKKRFHNEKKKLSPKIKNHN